MQPGQDDRGAIWSRRLADEFWSGPVTPLTYSLLAPPMVERMVARPLATAGLDELGRLPVFRLHASHVYVNAALLAEVIGRLPGLVRSAGLMALLPPAARARVRPAGTLEGLPGAALIAGRLLAGERAWAPWQRAAAFEAACARVRRDLGGNDAAPLARPPWALVAEMRRVQDALGDYLAIVSWGVVFAYVFYHLLVELVRHWAPAARDRCGDLTVGLPGVASLEAHHDVFALGALLAADAAAGATPAATARRLRTDRGEAGARLHALLARHGHRLTGRDLLHPGWHEAPELVVGLALRSTRERHPALAATARRKEAVAAIERALGGGPLGLARRGVFRAALATAQRYYVVRENMRYHADFFLARLRALTLALGRRLAGDGAVAEPTDLFFLTFAELERAVAALDRPGEPDAPLAARAAERRTRYEREALATPPAVLDGAAESAPAGAARPDALAGETGAPGRCRGRARLVRVVGDFDRVAPGDVIVAAYADPAWTPMLDLASGLVLEAGGQLSHGAIVARELGIPALVKVEGALGSIREGDTIELDTTAAPSALVPVDAADGRTWRTP